MLVLPARQGRIHALAYSPDGRTLASGGEDGTIMLWNPADSTSTQHPIPKEGTSVQCIAFSPDGTRLAFGGGANFRLWDLAQGKVIDTLKRHNLPRVVAFSPNGLHLALGMLDGRLDLRRLQRSWRQSQVTVAFEATLLGVAFSPDNKNVALAGGGWGVGKAAVYDVPTGIPKIALEGHQSAVFGVASSPDGRTLATCSDDKTVRLWDAASGEEKAVLRGHEGTVSAVAFGADNRTVISVGWDGNVIFWDSQTHGERANLEVHTGMINAVAFAPDGMTAATAGQDGSIVIWDVDV